MIIKTLDFLNHFDFYRRYYFLFILKILNSSGTPLEASEYLGYFFLLNIDDCAQGISGTAQQPEIVDQSRIDTLRAYYEILLLEAKREEFCTEIDLRL